MAGGGGGANTNGQVDGNGGGGGGLTGGIGLNSSGGYLQSGYWGYSNNTNPATQTGGVFIFQGQTGVNNPFSAGGGGWYGGDRTNGGSGYIGGLTSGATIQTGSTLATSTTNPSTVLPGGSNSPYYVSGYGHGSNASGLVVIVPAIGSGAIQVGAGANIFTL